MTEGMATICPIPEQQVWGETVWSVQTQGLGLQLTGNAAHKNTSKTWPCLLAPSIGRTRIEVRLTWYGGTDGVTAAYVTITSRLGVVVTRLLAAAFWLGVGRIADIAVVRRTGDST
jgi:hypothetical protein